MLVHRRIPMKITLKSLLIKEYGAELRGEFLFSEYFTGVLVLIERQHLQI